MAQLFVNNASAQLISLLSAADTQITLGPGQGAAFPTPVANDDDSFAICSLENTLGQIEIVKLTARTGDTLTVERAQESTTAKSFAIGSRLECRLTAGSLQNFQQTADKTKLRGGIAQTDGLDVWHATNASVYQAFSIRYNQQDLHDSVNALSFSGPVGVSNLGILFELTGVAGERSTFKFVAGQSNSAPAPGTGYPEVQVPGLLSFKNLVDPKSSGTLYATLHTVTNPDNNVDRSALRFQGNSVGTGLFSYRFYADVAKDRFVSFQADGAIGIESGIRVYSGEKDKYPTTDAVHLQNVPLDVNPESGDRFWFLPTKFNQVARTLQYRFDVRSVENSESATPNIQIKSIVFNEDGNINIEGDPSHDNHVVTKKWVEQTYGKKTLSGETQTVASAALTTGMLKRTVLFRGLTSIGAITLNQAYTDFHQILITARIANLWSHNTFDTEELAAANHYSVVDDSTLSFQPTNATTLTVTRSSNAGGIGYIGGIAAVIGLWPKNP